MVLERIGALLASSSDEKRHFPATQLYKEGWLLCLVMDYLAQNHINGHCLNLMEGADWFSEAYLPSAFLKNPPSGKKLNEKYTHADGVIGHFDIGDRGKADLSLKKGAQQFLVLEAKMFSELSERVTNADYFDQAARTIACMAEVLHRAKQSPSELKKLGFYVLAPESQINEKRVFEEKLALDSIRMIVQRRVAEYEDEAKNQWYKEWFEPLLGLDCFEIQAISWESIIEFIRLQDAQAGEEFQQFYQLCFEFNKKTGKRDKNRV